MPYDCPSVHPRWSEVHAIHFKLVSQISSVMSATWNSLARTSGPRCLFSALLHKYNCLANGAPHSCPASTCMSLSSWMYWSPDCSFASSNAVAMLRMTSCVTGKGSSPQVASSPSEVVGGLWQASWPLSCPGLFSPASLLCTTSVMTPRTDISAPPLRWLSFHGPLGSCRRSTSKLQGRAARAWKLHRSWLGGVDQRSPSLSGSLLVRCWLRRSDPPWGGYWRNVVLLPKWDGVATIATLPWFCRPMWGSCGTAAAHLWFQLRVLSNAHGNYSVSNWISKFLITSEFWGTN